MKAESQEDVPAQGLGVYDNMERVERRVTETSGVIQESFVEKVSTTDAKFAAQ